MASSIRVCVCTVSLSAVDGFTEDGFVSTCVRDCQSVCCRWLRRYGCACTVSLSAVDGFVGMCVRVLSVCLP